MLKQFKCRIFFALFLIVCISLITFSGCTKNVKTTSEETAVPVKTSKIIRGTIQNINTISGRIIGDKEINVVGKVSGRVAEVLVDVGDRVKKGDVLVKLETEELMDQLKQAEAALAAAEANLKANESGAIPRQLDQARSAYRQAEANYLNAKDDYERMKALYEEQAISKQDFDSIILKYTVAKTQYESAKEQLRLTEESSVRNIEALRAQVKQAQASVDLIRTNIKNSTITSPIDGIISNRFVDPGEMAAAGSPVVTAVNIDKVKIEINVPEAEINKLSAGQELDVTVEAISDNNTFKGTITNISPAADAQTRLFQVKLLIDNEEHILKPGMFAQVKLITETKKDALLIPKDAIVMKKEGNIVYVVKDNRVVQRNVKLGITNLEYVEVLEGLSEGEEVVVTGQNLLCEGALVKITN